MEYGAWGQCRTGEAGCRGVVYDAGIGKKYGLYAEMSGSGKKSRYTYAEARTAHLYKFYPIRRIVRDVMQPDIFVWLHLLNHREGKGEKSVKNLIWC